MLLQWKSMTFCFYYLNPKELFLKVCPQFESGQRSVRNEIISSMTFPGVVRKLNKIFQNNNKLRGVML